MDNSNKFKLALIIWLAPFFSFANDLASQNIFQNGTVPVTDPYRNSGVTYDCYLGSAKWGRVSSLAECRTIFTDQFLSQNDDSANDCFSSIETEIQTSDTRLTVNYTARHWKTNLGTPYCASNYVTGFNIGLYNEELTDSVTCPHPSEPEKTYGVDWDYDGEYDACAKPEDIDLFDSCKGSNPNLILDVTVTAPEGCMPQPDGSICHYKAHDVGGSQAYFMEYETSCYSDDYEDLSANQEIDMPSEQQCVQFGVAGLACLEQPENVCSDSGSVYAGGGIDSCQEGCGYVNGNFVCIDENQDGDNLPDYNDPDIDGDGIRNEDDLDSDGDGNDDPINGNDGSGSGTGTGTGTGTGLGELDLSPVVEKLEEIKKTMTESETELRQKPKEDLTSFWESEYEEGLEGIWDEKQGELESTAFIGFLDQFQPSFGGGSVNYSFCFNLGAMGNFGCQEMPIDSRIFPAIKIFILITAAFLCRRIIFGG